jgi:hypothetical protein
MQYARNKPSAAKSRVLDKVAMEFAIGALCASCGGMIDPTTALCPACAQPMTLIRDNGLGFSTVQKDFYECKACAVIVAEVVAANER